VEPRLGLPDSQALLKNGSAAFESLQFGLPEAKFSIHPELSSPGEAHSASTFRD
jgi:hypothetical protein